LIQADGVKYKLKVQRHYCKSCGSWHRELPDIIVPFKRHCRETIELIINGEEAVTYTENETAKRIMEWWALMAAYILGALPAVKAKFGVAVPAKDNLAKIVRALVNTNLWPCTRSALDAVP